jgi:hypothetical protein
MRVRPILLSTAFAFFLSVAFVSAWTGPTAAPPGNNAAAPLNVGSVNQVKNGNIGVNGLAVFGNTLLQGSSYLNFGSTAGSGGYGIWDNGGTLNFKNSGGSWQSLQTIVSNLVGGGSLTGPYLPTYASWASSGTGSGGAAIYNDNGTYRTLMIVGNNSAGGNREVKVWDDLTVSNDLTVDAVTNAAGGISLGDVGNRQVLWLAGNGDCNHAIYSDANSPCGYNSPTGSNDSEYFDYFAGLVFQPREGGSPSYFDSSGNLNVGDNLTVYNGSASFNNGPYTNDWFRVNGGGGIYWQAYGGGWYMQDSTWIRSYGGKYLYESAGLDTGGASGINCGGGLGGGYTFRVCGTADVTSTITATAFYYDSDERLKKNIVPIPQTSALSDVLGLQPVTYNWINPSLGTSTQIGFIAQQVKTVVPEIVATNASTTMESVDYARVTPLLVGSVQELDQTIQAQQTQLDAQQTDITTQQKEINALTAEIQALQSK